MPNPYASIAKPLPQNPYSSIARPTNGQNPPATVTQGPSKAQLYLQDAENFGKGAIKGLGHTLYDIGAPAGWAAQAMGLTHETPQQHEQQVQMFQPHGTMQQIGHGLEQAGEFLTPGLGEESLLKDVPEATPFLKPIARVGFNALASGAINKAQGGGFGTGAAAGAAGAGIGEAARGIAPSIAETALRIGKRDRAFGRGGGSLGRAILDETRGVRPSTISESAGKKIQDITPELENLYDRASVRKTPLALPAPAEKVSLGGGQIPRSTRGGLFPAQETDEVGSPWSEAHPNDPKWGKNINQRNDFLEFLMQSARPSEETASGSVPVPNTMYSSGGAHPELSGRFLPEKGIWVRPQSVAEPMPNVVPNETVSLRGPRDIVSNAMGRAASQEASGLHGQLQGLSDFLNTGQVSGEPIPEMITPRRGLNLKRGLAKEFLGKWNPDTYSDTVATGRKAYHSLDKALDEAVPGSENLNRRLTNLIPIEAKAENLARESPFWQRASQRMAARTGGAILGGWGGYEGYKEGGIPGAIAGGAAGLLGPELIGDPEAQMIMARTLNNAGAFRLPTGVLLNLTRPSSKGGQEK